MTGTTTSVTAIRGIVGVVPTADRRSWSFRRGHRSPEEPVDRARPVENAQNAFPTRSLDGAQNAPPTTLHRPCYFCLSLKKEQRKMTTPLRRKEAETTIHFVASLR